MLFSNSFAFTFSAYLTHLKIASLGLCLTSCSNLPRASAALFLIGWILLKASLIPFLTILLSASLSLSPKFSLTTRSFSPCLTSTILLLTEFRFQSRIASKFRLVTAEAKFFIASFNLLLSWSAWDLADLRTFLAGFSIEPLIFMPLNLFSKSFLTSTTLSLSTKAFQFLKAISGPLMNTRPSRLIVRIAMLPDLTSRVKTSFKAFLGMRERTNCSLWLLMPSSIFFDLHAITKSFQSLSANLTFLSTAKKIVLSAPTALLPPPMTRWQASFKVLTGMRLSRERSLCERTASSMCLDLHSCM